MKRRHAILVSLVLGTAGSIGCGDRMAPTEPLRPAVSLEKVVAPPQDLSGDWSGTITFHAFESEDQPLLCDGTASVRVALRQDGDSFSGQFSTPCAGTITIRGMLDGLRLSGTLDGSSGRKYGVISGNIYADLIRFHTDKSIDKMSSAVTTQVELRHLHPSPRTLPLLSDGGRSHSALSPRR